jgi:hypothetical protein
MTERAPLIKPLFFTPVTSGLLQRKCADCGQSSLTGGNCDKCKKEQFLQHHVTHQDKSSQVPVIVHEVLQSPGQPLDVDTRIGMESNFNHDFSSVRVHTDALAAESATTVNALAYTVGQDIMFANQQYAPNTSKGKQLLAHELTHVVQQGGSNSNQANLKTASFLMPSSGEQSIELGSVNAPEEHEAEQKAAQVINGEGVHVSPNQNSPALRRQGTSLPTTSGTAQQASSTTTSRPSEQWAFDVSLGSFTRYQEGRGDARLNRRPVLEARRRQRGETPPCELELQLKLRFEFHLGTSPHRVGGPMSSTISEPGPPWPQERAEQWKQEYMRIAQEMWQTRHVLVPTQPCPSEPCTQVVGRLRIIDVDTMTDAEQRRVAGDVSPTEPHFTVKVYEYRSQFHRNESRVGFSDATMYAEDVLPRNAPQPSGFDSDRHEWRPGAAAHETGHMLGRPHVNCPPDAADPNAEICYGATNEQQANVMGRGSNMSREDHAPFLAALRTITQCSWQVSSSGMPGWLIGLLVAGGVALLGGGIALAAALL